MRNPFRRRTPPATMLRSSSSVMDWWQLCISTETSKDFEQLLRSMPLAALIDQLFRLRQFDSQRTNISPGDAYLNTYLREKMERELDRRRQLLAHPAADDQLELVPGALVGYRTWRVVSPLLRSLVFAVPWPPFERLEASCGLEFHRNSNSGGIVPHELCRCGIYALKELDHCFAAWTIRSRTNCVVGAVCIVGAVSLWGRIEEHQYGYRAQYAYPKEFFFCAPENAHLVELVAETYGVKVSQAPL